MAITLAELAAHVGGTLVGGNAESPVTGVAGYDLATASEVTYVSEAKHLAAAAASPALAILLPAALASGTDKAQVLVADARSAFARALQLFDWRTPPVPGIHPTAVVASSATIAASAHIGAQVVIGEEAVIGEGCVIHPQVVVGDRVAIGPDTVIYPHVTIYARCTIGQRVIIHAGTVVGADGLGFQPGPGGWEKIPHLGTVVIEDDVEIGATVTIDRATTGHTVIGTGTKIDNLVQIAHNVKIGPHCMIIAQTGISGSAVIEAGVVLAARAGVGGHLTIGARARVGALSGVVKSVPPGVTVSGYPAQPHTDELRYQASLRRVPDLLARVKALEKQVAALTKEE